MKATCIQMDMLFAQPEENFAKAKRLIREAMASGPDVVVLPETWNTGFFPKERLSELAERDCARVKRELGGLAAELGVNLVAGSVANVRGGKVYNTACVFDRAGNCVAEYDKTHLFTPMGEHAYFTPGDHLCRFRLDGHDRRQIIDVALFEHEQAEQREPQILGQLLGRRPIEQHAHARIAPTHTRHAVERTCAVLPPRAQTAAHLLESHGGVAQQQIGCSEQHAVALRQGEHVGRRHAGDDHLDATLEQLVDEQIEELSSRVIEHGNVLQNDKLRPRVEREDAGQDRFGVEIAQETGRATVDPEHVAKREDDVGVLEHRG